MPLDMEFHIKRYDIPDVEKSVKDSGKGYLNEDPFKFGKLDDYSHCNLYLAQIGLHKRRPCPGGNLLYQTYFNWKSVVCELVR